MGRVKMPKCQNDPAELQLFQAMIAINTPIIQPTHLKLEYSLTMGGSHNRPRRGGGNHPSARNNPHNRPPHHHHGPPAARAAAATTADNQISPQQQQQQRQQNPPTGPRAMRMPTPHPSFIQVAKPYVFEHTIQECLAATGVDPQREDDIRISGVTWIDNVRKALRLYVKYC